jgi:hypothetical protein
MSGYHLRGLVRNREFEGVQQDHAVSYGDKQLFVALTCGITRFSTIEFERFGERYAQGRQQSFACSFLAIYAWHFLDPANPIAFVLFDDGSVFSQHWRILRYPHDIRTAGSDSNAKRMGFLTTFSRPP